MPNQGCFLQSNSLPRVHPDLIMTHMIHNNSLVSENPCVHVAHTCNPAADSVKVTSENGLRHDKNCWSGAQGFHEWDFDESVPGDLESFVLKMKAIYMTSMNCQAALERVDWLVVQLSLQWDLIYNTFICNSTR